MNSFDNLRCPIWKSQAALVALKSNSKYFQTNDLSHTGPPLSVSCFPNSTVIISSWKGSPSTFLMNLKVPIWSFVAENTFPIFKVLITSVESEKLFNFSPYSVLPIPGPIWGKRLQPLRYSSLELVMCIRAKCVLYGHIALTLGSLDLKRLTDWEKHVCWPLLSRALHTGPAWNCFQEWLGLECWQEISIWAQPSVKLNYWQSETGIVRSRSRQNNLFEWKPQTCHSTVYLARSGWEPLSVCLSTFSAWVLLGLKGWALGLPQWEAQCLSDKIEDHWRMTSLVLRESAVHYEIRLNGRQMTA